MSQTNGGNAYELTEHRSLGKYILLSLVTLGIYGIYFIYKYVKDMNVVCEGDGKKTRGFFFLLVFSILTLGIYYYIWLYGVGERVSINCQKRGLPCNTTGSNVLMWQLFGSLIIIGPFIVWAKLIDGMNTLTDDFLHSGRQSSYYGSSNPYQSYGQQNYAGQGYAQNFSAAPNANGYTAQPFNGYGQPDPYAGQNAPGYPGSANTAQPFNGYAQPGYYAGQGASPYPGSANPAQPYTGYAQPGYSAGQGAPEYQNAYSYSEGTPDYAAPAGASKVNLEKTAAIDFASGQQNPAQQSDSNSSIYEYYANNGTDTDSQQASRRRHS